MQSHEGCIKHQISAADQVLCKVVQERFTPASWARRDKSMKRIGWTTDKTGKVSSAVAAALLVVLALAHPVRSAAQATGVASIHGHVVNPAGVPLNKGDIRVMTDRDPDAKARQKQDKYKTN